eukprot:s180_g8.t1
MKEVHLDAEILAPESPPPLPPPAKSPDREGSDESSAGDAQASRADVDSSVLKDEEQSHDPVDVFQLQALAAAAECTEQDAVLADQLWRGEPSEGKVPWCTWYRKVCAVLGHDLNGHPVPTEDPLTR